MRTILASLLCCASLTAELPTLYPPALQKGDLVAIVLPSSFLDNREEGLQLLDQKTAWLEQQGYRTIRYPATLNPVGYLSGSDAERGYELMNAWKNDEVKAIWCFRGGYGAGRILNLLDYEWIKSHPKIFIGMSDITALHHAIQQRTGLVTFLAPVLNHFGTDLPDYQYSFSSLENTIVNAASGEVNLPILEKPIEIIRSGIGEGKLIGGNLTLIASLCGTPWQLDTRGKILILEDVGEEIYRIDRMLWQLKEAGLLDAPAGVILGTWRDCGSTKMNSLSLNDVFEHYFGSANYPVILGFPTGHVGLQVTIPLNARASMDTYQKSIKWLEPAVQLCEEPIYSAE